MRIAFLTTEYPSEPHFAGGLASYTYRTAGLLADAGHDVEVFTWSTERGSETIDSVVVHRVPTLRRLEQSVAKLPLVRRYYGYAKAVSRSWCLAKSLDQRHRQAPFDIVQAANCEACGVVATRRGDVALVTRLSGYMPAWRPLQGVATIRKHLQNDWAQRLQLRRSAAVYAPSEFVAQMVRQHEGLEVSVIEPPFETAASCSDSTQLPAQLEPDGYMLYFGTLCLHKGTDRLLAILPELLRRQADLRFVFAGRVWSDLAGIPFDEKITKQLAAFGDRVRVLPPQRHDMLFPLIANARCVVLPSRIDNLPNTCMEAMALRRVVVATREASFEQLIDHSVNGFLVSQTDDSELVERLSQVWSMGCFERAQIGEAACRALDRLKPERTIGRLLELFKSIASDHNAKRNRKQRTTRPQPSPVAASK